MSILQQKSGKPMSIGDNVNSNYFNITGVSYKRFPSVAGQPNLYSVIDG